MTGRNPYDCAPMQRQPLPKLVDARKFIAIGTEIHAVVAVSELGQFVDGLASDSGAVDVDISFFRDEQGFKCISGRASASVELTCHRCLKPMMQSVDAEFSLAVVWTEEQAKALPKYYDPVILGEESLVLRDLVAEELILSTPFVSYHEDVNCSGLEQVVEPVVDNENEVSGDSPFAVLGQLKSQD